MGVGAFPRVSISLPLTGLLPLALGSGARAGRLLVGVRVPEAGEPAVRRAVGGVTGGDLSGSRRSRLGLLERFSPPAPGPIPFPMVGRNGGEPAGAGGDRGGSRGSILKTGMRPTAAF